MSLNVHGKKGQEMRKSRFWTGESQFSRLLFRSSAFKQDVSQIRAGQYHGRMASKVQGMARWEFREVKSKLSGVV